MATVFQVHESRAYAASASDASLHRSTWNELSWSDRVASFELITTRQTLRSGVDATVIRSLKRMRFPKGSMTSTQRAS
jgi:hypothetical protein